MQRLTRNLTNLSLTWLTDGTTIHMYKCTGNPLKRAIFHFAQMSTFCRSNVQLYPLTLVPNSVDPDEIQHNGP